MRHAAANCARRNFVFCGDIVPRLVGNTDYITKILSELEEESKGHFMLSVGLAISRIFIGNVREQFKAKVQHSMSSTDGLLALLSNYSHWSQLIYYQEKKTLDLAKYEFGCTLMSAEQFGKHFPESMKTSWGAFIWGYVWGASEVLLKADLIKTGPSQAYHNPESRSKKKVFTTVTDYLKDVHNVLPYASEYSLLSSHCSTAICMHMFCMRTPQPATCSPPHMHMFA